jgi:hypothetical protein
VIETVAAGDLPSTAAAIARQMPIQKQFRAFTLSDHAEFLLSISNLQPSSCSLNIRTNA